jgi:hypothetical protein
MKPWWKSRTLWFNALMAGTTAAEASLGPLQHLIGEWAYPAIAFGITVGNAVLRVVTKRALRG